MRRSALAVGIAAAPVWLGACSLALSFSGIDDGTPDGGLESGLPASDGAAIDQTDVGSGGDSSNDTGTRETGGPGPDAAMDSGIGMADGPSADARSDSGDASPPEGGCPQGAPGPAMVSVGSYCIDSTEVTLAQYEAFLTAKAGDTSGQPVPCQWNTSYTPQNDWPPSPSAPPDQAMRGVNWCDAYMYCAWAGKRLCGNADGGSSDPNNANNPAINQWFRACSHNADGLHVYPYGLTYDASACNGADRDAGGPLPSLPTCQGGYPGIFDMSGNVIEWEDSCTPTPTSPDAGDTSGASDFCNVRGGSFLSPGGQPTCDLGVLVQRFGGGGDNGFRCCSR